MTTESIKDLPQLRELRPGESVRMVLRRHWIVLVHTFFYLSFLTTSSLTLIFNREALSWILPPGLVIMLAVVYMAVFILFIYVDWISNELDFFVFTNERIIGIQQVSFLNRAISECSMDRVQEVNASSKGLIANIFNYGTVDIRTASEDSHFEMHVVPEPVEQARRILNIVQEHKGIKSATPESRPL